MSNLSSATGALLFFERKNQGGYCLNMLGLMQREPLLRISLIDPFFSLAETSSRLYRRQTAGAANSVA
jgi:hypothetical protein